MKVGNQEVTAKKEVGTALSSMVKEAAQKTYLGVMSIGEYGGLKVTANYGFINVSTLAQLGPKLFHKKTVRKRDFFAKGKI